MEEKGTQNLKEVLDFALTLTEVVIGATKDGKIGLDDAALLFKLIPVAGPAVEGWAEVPQELSDLGEEEAAGLIAHVVANLAVEDEKAKMIVEKGLKTAAAVYGLVKAIKE